MGIIVLLFIGVVFAFPAPPFTIATITPLLLLLTSTLMALAYMIGKVINDERMLAWVKVEFSEVLFSALLLALALPVLNSLDTTVNALTTSIAPFSCPPSTLPCHITLARDYLNSLFFETAGFFKRVGMAYSFLASLPFTVSNELKGVPRFLGWASYTTSLGFSFLKTKLNFYRFLFSYLTNILIILRVQDVFIAFTYDALAPSLLFLGIALRSFFLTRRVGGLMVAIALGTYYVFPTFLVFGDAIYYNLITHPNSPAFNITINDTHLPLLTQSLESVAQPHWNVSADVISDKVNLTDFCSQLRTSWSVDNVEITTQEWEESNTYFINLVDKYAGIMNLNPFSVKHVFQNMALIDITARLLFLSSFFAFVGAIATIAFIKVFSPLIGGDVEIAGLTRLI